MIPTKEQIEELYTEYRLPLAKYATRWVRDFYEAEGVVDKIFLAILERPRDLFDHPRKYLYKSVKRECFNKIRRYHQWKLSEFDPSLSTFATITKVDDKLLAARVLEKAKILLKPREYRLLIEWMERPKQDKNNILSQYERVVLNRAKNKLRAEFLNDPSIRPVR